MKMHDGNSWMFMVFPLISVHQHLTNAWATNLSLSFEVDDLNGRNSLNVQQWHSKECGSPESKSDSDSSQTTKPNESIHAAAVRLSVPGPQVPFATSLRAFSTFFLTLLFVSVGQLAQSLPPSLIKAAVI